MYARDSLGRPYQVAHMPEVSADGVPSGLPVSGEGEHSPNEAFLKGALRPFTPPASTLSYWDGPLPFDPHAAAPGVRGEPLYWPAPGGPGSAEHYGFAGVR